jgi:hypothetical protein
MLALPPVLEGSAVAVVAPVGTAARPAARGEGSLRPRPVGPEGPARDAAAGEGEPV